MDIWISSLGLFRFNPAISLLLPSWLLYRSCEKSRYKYTILFLPITMAKDCCLGSPSELRLVCSQSLMVISALSLGVPLILKLDFHLLFYITHSFHIIFLFLNFRILHSFLSVSSTSLIWLSAVIKKFFLIIALRAYFHYG